MSIDESKYERMPTPGEIAERHPIELVVKEQIERHRKEVGRIVEGSDSRLLVIVGPCSLDPSKIGNTYSAVKFAEEIAKLDNDEFISDHIKLVMRSPVSKPRTSTGWAGMSQTHLEESYAILTEVANKGVPIAIEVMGPIDADYFADVVSMVWVGARDVESTNVRHIVSDIGVPALFKNSTTGSFVAAENAMKTASSANQVWRIGPDGQLRTRKSSGNSQVGAIYRGGNATTPEEFESNLIRLNERPYPVVIDTSHANTAAFGGGERTAKAQRACISSLLRIMQSGAIKPAGVMVESYLLSGADPSRSTPGQSWTDPCIGLPETKEVIQDMARIMSMRSMGSMVLKS